MQKLKSGRQTTLDFLVRNELEVLGANDQETLSSVSSLVARQFELSSGWTLLAYRIVVNDSIGIMMPKILKKVLYLRIAPNMPLVSDFICGIRILVRFHFSNVQRQIS